MGDSDPWLTSAGAAEVMGWSGAAVWRAEVSKGRAPVADDPDLDRPPAWRMPRWRRSTVEAFKVGRPGRGFRSDLHKKEGN
jgi:hypothetical protein